MNLKSKCSLTMTSMFCDCYSLTSLDLSSFITSKVTDMSFMFDCNYPNRSKLTSINLSSFDTSKVKNMCAMFAKCTSLTSLDLSNFNMSSVTDTRDMISNCTALLRIKLPKVVLTCQQQAVVIIML